MLGVAGSFKKKAGGGNRLPINMILNIAGRENAGNAGSWRIPGSPVARDNITVFHFFFFFKQKTAYEMIWCLEFRRVLFRSHRPDGNEPRGDGADPGPRAACRLG